MIQARGEGKKCVAYVCENTPEPLLNLEGCFSARLRAPRTSSMEMATYYLTSFLCEYSRALLEQAMEGGFNFADCLIAPDGCSMINRCVENMELLHTMDQGKESFFYENMEIPMKADGNGLNLFVVQCKNHILKPLQEKFGIDVSDAAIRRSVAEHNRVCELIRAIGDFRKGDKPTITGYEFSVITLATYAAPKYLIMGKLEETLEELKTREPDEKSPFLARVVIVGSEIDDPEFIKLVESTGTYVCADRYCDGSLMGNGVISKRLELEDGIPVFQLATPLRHREDDVQEYAAQEIRNAIAFIEEKTGEKWDWTHYFECAKRVNYATKCRMEWLEMNKTPYPQVFGSNLALYTETNYMAISGRLPVFEEADRKITALAEKAYQKKKIAANEYRHRAIVWGVQSHFYMDFLVWLLNCWGIVPLTDMLSMVSTKMIAETDTPENREQAIYDIAWLTENMIMRNRTHGGYKVLLDELWEFVEEFNADMVILWEHMSCKALDGMHGQFEEKARERGIHLVWVSHDLFDPRVISRQGVRDQINSYMRTVMQEEPVDPSLETLDDAESW